MGQTLPFSCCFAIVAGRAGSKHRYMSAAPGTLRDWIYFSLTQLSWFNFCSVEYRRSFHRQWVTASCISYSISPLTRQDLYNCTKAISYQSSFLPPCLISPICACQDPHRCFHVTLEVAVLLQYSYHFYSYQSPLWLSEFLGTKFRE